MGGWVSGWVRKEDVGGCGGKTGLAISFQP